MKTRDEVVALFEKAGRDPHRQGDQAEISFLDFEKLNLYKASLFRDGAAVVYAGANAYAEKGWSPSVWSLRTHDGFATARLVFDGRPNTRGAFVTIDLEGEPIWIGKEQFRADEHQFAAIWAALPEEAKTQFRDTVVKWTEANLAPLLEKLDGYRKPADGSDAPVERTDQEIIAAFLKKTARDHEGTAEIEVVDWLAIDEFKQTLFASDEGVVHGVIDPEEIGEWRAWTLKSPDGFAEAQFIFDRVPTFFASISLENEPYWNGYDMNEAGDDQIRRIYAMLSVEAKENIRNAATAVDPDYYQTMIDYLCPVGDDPTTVPSV